MATFTPRILWVWVCVCAHTRACASVSFPTETQLTVARFLVGWGWGATTLDGDIAALPFLRVLSFNNLTRLDEESLAELSSLSVLRLSHNSISHIAEGAFKGLRSLRVLYVSHY